MEATLLQAGQRNQVGIVCVKSGKYMFVLTMQVDCIKKNDSAAAAGPGGTFI